MKSSELINFGGMEPVSPSIIMVAGVGGGGSNAVNHMFDQGIAQVTFMVCNTDKQALSRSPVSIQVKLGEALTEGLGAGNNPERGRAAATESLDEIIQIFKREKTKMVFITAGMGGGTGTGAAPVIAKAAREMGILTVGIVTLPFKAEGKVRAANAMEGIEEMRKYVDALLVINNENIQEIYGKLALTEAFGKADDILASAARGIAEVIMRDDVIVNVDFADVCTVMRDSGIALMGSGRAAGEHRAQEVAEQMLRSPLLNHNNIDGAKNILLNISSGEEEITMAEMIGMVEYIQERAGNGANIIWGAGREPSLGPDIEATIIATGFNMDEAEMWTTARPSARDKAVLSPGRHIVEEEIPMASGEAVEEVESAGFGGDESAPAKRVTHWEPPKHAPHPFEQQRAARRPGGLEVDPRPPHDTGVPPAQPGNVIKVQQNDIYDNLNDIENSPSYVRRRARLIVDAAPHASKGSRTVIREKEDSASESNAPKGGSLFD